MRATSEIGVADPVQAIRRCVGDVSLIPGTSSQRFRLAPLAGCACNCLIEQPESSICRWSVSRLVRMRPMKQRSPPFSCPGAVEAVEHRRCGGRRGRSSKSAPPFVFYHLDMTADRMQGPEAFERSRAHRRGVRQACIDLENALARPAGQDLTKWSAAITARFRDLIEAFRRHAEQSEGPEGLLPEIVESAPRLAHAVEQVQHEHQILLVEMARLESLTSDMHGTQIDEIREDSLRLLQDIAAHRQRGADLIYEAYSVDIEGGEG